MIAKDIPVPENWPHYIRTAMLHAASLAHYAVIYTRSMSANSKLSRVRLAGELDKSRNACSLLMEQVRILQTRVEKMPAKSRPYYAPEERMAILLFKATNGWNNKQTAEAFCVTPETISYWMKQLAEDGENALVQTPVPVNKYPEFVKYVSQTLKTLCPRMGKKTIAEYFARSGLHLSGTTIGRALKAAPIKKPDDSPEPETDSKESDGRIVKSRHPNHTWLVDLTAVPVSGGFWMPWKPFSLPQIWPFCWWIMIVKDHFSRKVVGFSLFLKPPTSDEVTKVLGKAIKRTERKPKYIISDKGTQFWPNNAKPENRDKHPYRVWCEKKKIKPRYGAVGKYGSIAIIERFMRSLKDECTRRISVPMDFTMMREELSLYIEWYNCYRPHQYLNARTPEEVYAQSPPLKLIQDINNCDLPRHELKISYLEGRKHLPIVEIKKAA